jgi:GNAT superfamily N-acetyltransferase
MKGPKMNLATELRRIARTLRAMGSAPADDLTLANGDDDGQIYRAFQDEDGQDVAYLGGEVIQGEWAIRDWAQEYMIDEDTVDELVRFGTVVVLDGMEAEPQARGKGLGTKLLDGFLKDFGSMPIVLVADQGKNTFDLVAWYESHGFVEWGTNGVMPVMVREPK